MKPIFAIAVLLSSLVTFAKQPTPTITVNAPLTAVKGAATTQLLKSGWRLSSESESQVVFMKDRSVGWTMVAAFGGSPAGCPPPHIYLTLTFAEVEGNTLITSHEQYGFSAKPAAGVPSGPGVGCHEQINDTHGKGENQKQNDLLTNIKSLVETPAHVAPPSTP